MLLGFLLVIQIIVASALTGVILLQRSEGGALGMGGGPSGFMTARGAGDLLTRITGILATIFFILSIALTVVAGQGRSGGSVVDRLDVQSVNPDTLTPPPAAPPAAPGAPAAPAVGGFQAPTPQVNTAPAAPLGAPPTTTQDSGAQDPASRLLGVQVAPQATQPQPQAPAR